MQTKRRPRGLQRGAGSRWAVRTSRAHAHTSVHTSRAHVHMSLAHEPHTRAMHMNLAHVHMCAQKPHTQAAHTCT